VARHVQVRTLRTAEAFLAHVAALGIALPFDAGVVPDGPLAAPLPLFGRTAANRFAILPMEGWDGTDDGRPTELVLRRWRRFGESGAGLIWGGEAVAVRADGRANPRQLVITSEVAALRAELLGAHPDPERCVVGLQLTHSGRWSANGPLVAYAHPLLDARVGGTVHVLSDTELDDLVADFVRAAVVARDAGYDFVDVKHCHGYLLHELLSARTRPGPYGGDLDGRMRFLTEVVRGIRRDAPQLGIGVRLSAFDLPPYRDGRPEATSYEYAFGGDGAGGIDLSEPAEFLRRCTETGVGAVSITAGSPYYCPHVQRPAYFPPSDGYAPPRDPLIEVAQMLHATTTLKRAHPALVFVGSGYSYLQEWLPHVAQAAVGAGDVDAVGLGRLVLSYPHLPADVLRGAALERRLLCRTFSDCTSAPRNGLVSGCYPLDEFYKAMPERRVLAKAKRA
jgi:2,4-dienoyl-CoA reductase-like NADH-dependent reductase (Old Yellow Enzyme family)